MESQENTKKNVVENSTVSAGRDIHIGDNVYNQAPQVQKNEKLKGIKKFEAKIRQWLKKRYQNRLDQKMAGRLPVNLKRVDFSGIASDLSKKVFKEIAPDAIEDELAEFFKTAEGRLLVVGAPGAGKTTLLLQLAVSLLENERDTLPVVVNLATWSKGYKSLDEWLKKILPVEMGVSTPLALRLLAESRVVLLFDGLDEIADPDQRRACITAIDLFVSPARPRREFVISSRTQEFLEAGRVPLVSFPIEVGALTIHQIQTELTRRNPAQPEDRDLLAALQTDPLLLEAAETPFYFNCLQLLFGENQRPVFSAGDRKGREREILDAFVGNEINKCPKWETLNWLEYLAKQMDANELVRFELRDLQFNWGKGWEKWEGVMIGAISGLMFGILPAFLVGIIFNPLAGMGALTLSIWFFGETMYHEIFTLDSVSWSSIFNFNGFIRFVNKIFQVHILVLFIWLITYEDKNLVGIKEILKSFWHGDINIVTIWWNQKLDSLLSLFKPPLMSFLISVGVFLWLVKTNSYAHIQTSTPYQRFTSSAKNLHFSIIQHWLLRYLLFKKGFTPINLVDFLNEMSSKKVKKRRFSIAPVHLMESDGASWRFRHRLIQEWFAAPRQKNEK